MVPWTMEIGGTCHGFDGLNGSTVTVRCEVSPFL